jgi:hypothetical protein
VDEAAAAAAAGGEGDGVDDAPAGLVEASRAAAVAVVVAAAVGAASDESGVARDDVVARLDAWPSFEGTMSSPPAAAAGVAAAVASWVTEPDSRAASAFLFSSLCNVGTCALGVTIEEDMMEAPGLPGWGDCCCCGCGCCCGCCDCCACFPSPMRLGRTAGLSSEMLLRNCSARRRTPTPGLGPDPGNRPLPGEYPEPPPCALLLMRFKLGCCSECVTEPGEALLLVGPELSSEEDACGAGLWPPAAAEIRGMPWLLTAWPPGCAWPMTGWIHRPPPAVLTGCSGGAPLGPTPSLCVACCSGESLLMK